MRRPLAVAALTVAAALAGGCEDNGFEQFQEIAKLRVLAIRATPAELAPGGVVTLDALAVDPRGGAIRYEWELCVFDEGPDGRYACAVDPDTGEELGATISTGPTATVPYELVEEALGDIQALCDELGATDVPDFIELPDCERGFPLRVRLTARVAEGQGDDEEVAVSELMVLLDGVAPNSRPELGDVLLDEEPIPPARMVPLASEDEPWALRAIVDPAQSETYDDDGEEARERLKLTWFTTGGSLERTSTWFDDEQIPVQELQTNELDPQGGNTPIESGDTVTVYVVLRDDRGGVDFTQRSFSVGPAAEE